MQVICEHEGTALFYIPAHRDSRIYKKTDIQADYMGPPFTMILESPDEIQTFLGENKGIQKSFDKLIPVLESSYSEWKKREVAMLRKFTTLERSKNMEYKRIDAQDKKELEIHLMQIHNDQVVT